MKFFKEIKSSLDSIRKNKVDYLFFFFQLIVFQGAIKQFNNDTFVVLNLVLCFIFNLFRRRLTLKGLFPILLIISLILIIPSLQWGIKSLNTFIGFYVRIITAFLIISYFKISFLNKLENLIFILAFISIPLYMIQIAYIDFYDIFRGFSEIVLPEDFLNFGLGKLEGHRYLIIYNVNSWAELRNSGFAGEPAAFGALLTWASLINAFQNNLRTNFRYYTYLIAALTTFSISTFVAFLFVYLFMLLNTKKLGNAFYLGFVPIIVFSLFSIPFFQERTQYMGNKLNEYSTSLEDPDYSESTVIRRNRVQGFMVGFNLIADSPMGYGIDPENAPDETKSSNGFMLLLFKFGIIGFILVLYLIKRIFIFFKLYFSQNAKGLYAFILIVLITFNGNPFYNQPFFLAFLLSGFLILFMNKKLGIVFHNQPTGLKALLI